MDLYLINCEDITGFTLLRIKSSYVVCELCGVSSGSVKAGRVGPNPIQYSSCSSVRNPLCLCSCMLH
jgi:hypothetical protein